MFDLGVPTFMCFSSVIGQIVERCFGLPSVSDALVHLQATYNVSELHLSKNFWLSKFSTLDQYLASTQVAKLLKSKKDETKQAVKLLHRLIEYLTPFKVNFVEFFLVQVKANDVFVDGDGDNKQRETSSCIAYPATGKTIIG